MGEFDTNILFGRSTSRWAVSLESRMSNLNIISRTTNVSHVYTIQFGVEKLRWLSRVYSSVDLCYCKRLNLLIKWSNVYNW